MISNGFSVTGNQTDAICGSKSEAVTSSGIEPVMFIPSRSARAYSTSLETALSLQGAVLLAAVYRQLWIVTGLDPL